MRLLKGGHGLGDGIILETPPGYPERALAHQEFPPGHLNLEFDWKYHGRRLFCAQNFVVDRPGSDRLIDERDAAIEGASHMRAKQALDVFPTSSTPDSVD